MKDKIFTLIIGILIGAIVTAGVFLIINRNSSNSANMQNMEPGMLQLEEFDPNTMPGGRDVGVQEGKGGKRQNMDDFSGNRPNMDNSNQNSGSKKNNMKPNNSEQTQNDNSNT